MQSGYGTWEVGGKENYGQIAFLNLGSFLTLSASSLSLVFLTGS